MCLLRPTRWRSRCAASRAQIKQHVSFSVEYLRSHPDEAKNLIAEFTKSKRELVEQIPTDDWSTELAVSNIAAILKVMQQEGMLKKPLEAKSLIHEIRR